MSDQSEQPARHDPASLPWFEPATAIVLAVASLSSAWCSYQNSCWSGESSELETKAERFEQTAFELNLLAQQTEAMQLQAVIDAVDAQMEGDQKRADFYTRRFEGELKAAYDKWIALKPFENGDAPMHPLVPALYTPQHHAEIKDLLAKETAAEISANACGDAASAYLSNTVILASVMFFAGTVSTFKQPHVRWSALTFALVVFCYAMIRILMLPVA